MISYLEEDAMATTTAQGGDNFSKLIGDIYARWTLDCLIEIGYAISVDFITRPQLYLSNDIPDSIVDLRMLYGTDPSFPNTAQRQAMLIPIFGMSDGHTLDASTGTAPFHVARKKLIDACISFSERAVDTGIAMLLERVRSALVPLRAHLEGLNGRSLRLSSQQIQTVSNTVVGILRSPEVARIFSVSAADDKWPFNSTDPNGAKLIENAGSMLLLPQECKLSYTRFILLQRVAQEGARTLPLVLTTDPTSEQALLALITHGYTWGTSLRDFQQA
jgi:hypothetical protein